MAYSFKEARKLGHSPLWPEKSKSEKQFWPYRPKIVRWFSPFRCEANGRRHPVAYLGFQKEAPNVRWPLVLTQGGGKPSFPIFLLCQKTFLSTTRVERVRTTPTFGNRTCTHSILCSKVIFYYVLYMDPAISSTTTTPLCGSISDQKNLPFKKSYIYLTERLYTASN